MATEVKIIGRCDICGARDDTDNMHMELDLSWRGRQVKIDLCTHDMEDVGKLLAPLLDQGRPATSGKRDSREPREPRVRQRIVPEGYDWEPIRGVDGDLHCPHPGCDVAQRRAQHMARHWQIHPEHNPTTN